MLLPKQTISFRQLIDDGLTENEIISMSASLKLFPTPFKGIYYVPLDEERNGTFIDRPEIVLYRSVKIFLEDDNFYLSCDTAEEALGIRWHPSSAIHIVNSKLSRRIKLDKRIIRNRAKHTWRSRKIAKLLSFYGKELVFHRINNISDAKIHMTQSGSFATKLQIRKDKKRFHEALQREI